MTSVVIPPRGSATAVAQPPGPRGPIGPNGWTPIFAAVSDGDRRVLQVVAWTGGGGDPPVAGRYIGVTGLVSDIALAVDLRGLQGFPGDAATIVIHTVTTLAPGEPATVTNIGTEFAAVLDIGIPRGATGTIAGLDGPAVVAALGFTPANKAGQNFDGPVSVGGLRLGYLGLPPSAQTAAYTFALTDRGKLVRHNHATAHAFTIPPVATVAWEVGDTIPVTNANGSGVVTITPGAGVTLRQAGTTNTGSRALAANGLATLTMVAADEWLITGAGLT